MSHMAHYFMFHFQGHQLEIVLYFVLNLWSNPPYYMSMAPLSQNYQSTKNTHIV